MACFDWMPHRKWGSVDLHSYPTVQPNLPYKYALFKLHVTLHHRSHHILQTHASLKSQCSRVPNCKIRVLPMSATELKDISTPTVPHDTDPPKDKLPLLNVTSSASSDVSIDPGELESKYAAYVRHDAYGTWGRGELPLKEKILLTVAFVTLVPVRLILGVLILVFYYFVCRVCTVFKAPNWESEGQEDYAHLVGWRREVLVRVGKILARVMLFNFGFYWIRVTQKECCDENGCRLQPAESERPCVIVSNHISYLDILYHTSKFFPSFVAKRSVGKLPLVGIISKCLGCVYVQRESKSSEFKGVSGVITERIQEAQQNKHGPTMLLFPEGTTTNGAHLLPFRTGAFLAKVPVLPVILRYPYTRFSPAWDTISGVRHVFLLLCQFVNYLEAIHLPIYYPSQQEKDDPKLYASNVRKYMAAEGNLILSDIGLPEKRIYHAALNGLLPPS